jgi:V8-like Glu-specific endopeptidase
MSRDPYEVVTNPQPLTAEETAKVEQYWTPDKLAEAVPLPLPIVYMPRRLRESVRTTTNNAGTGLIISEPSPPDSANITPTATSFNTSLVANRTIYPYAFVGKLFMTFSGRNYVGTGWVIGERTVFTAGHCVHDRSLGWASNILFQAQFNDGSSAGSWALPSLGSLRGWTQDEDFEFDMGMGISTTPIRPVTGKAGWIANIDQIQGNINSIGYPSQPIPGYNFNGQNMWECNGGYIDTADGIMAMNNNMTPGCSGGPGMYSRSGTLYGTWVNSFRYNNEPNILRSPYFGENFLNLIQWMGDNNGDS